MNAQLASSKPVVTILTVVIAMIVVAVGGVVTITNPQSLSFHQYVTDIALMGGALGLGAGIGRGIDSNGQAHASARMLSVGAQEPVSPGDSSGDDG